MVSGMTFDFSGPHPSKVHPAKQLKVIVWRLREVRLIWALGVESRDDPHVVAGLQVPTDDLTSLTGDCRAPALRMHSDKAKEFLAKSVRSLLKTHGIRQTTNSGYDPAANGIAERWVGIVKVRATARLAEHRLPPDNWAYACRWVAYIHNHRVLGIRLNASYPLFGDVWWCIDFSRNRQVLRTVALLECVWANPLVLAESPLALLPMDCSTLLSPQRSGSWERDGLSDGSFILIPLTRKRQHMFEMMEKSNGIF